MRWLVITLSLAALGSGLAFGGCHRDPTRRCAAAYAHLLDLAKRQGSASERVRFVDACVRAWDPGRYRCLMTAKTVEQALGCKPTHVRPG